MLFVLILLALAAVVNLVDGKVGIAGIAGGGRAETWLVTLALIAGALAVAGFAVCKRWDGIFIDKENRISLSRFQLVLWTVLLVSALLTAGLINAMPPAETQPLAIEIPKEIWGLLGLGVFTAVAAPAIKSVERTGIPAPKATGTPEASKVLMARQGLTDEPEYVGRVLVKQTSRDARWIDMIYGDYEGAATVDMSKLQQLVFTLLLVAAYAMALWAKMLGTTAIHLFPAIDAGFLALLGISHTAYLADKKLGAS